MTLSEGSQLGPYEILGPIGAGGMGEVYRARDTRLDRTVAVKVLPAHLTSSDVARQRLEREARAVSSLSHPHICTLYDVGQQADVYYLVVEYLEGATLAERLEKGPLPTPELMSYAMQIADALEKAHRQGLIHRDLKPSNIMLTASGAKLLDFGLAKSVPSTSEASDLTAPATATSPLTAQGTIVGTYQYMAPEQLEGAEADARSDIFAFGVVLYEMTTGTKAFEGKTQAGLIAAILEREPPSISTVQPLAPPALDRLIRTCLAKDPEERRQSMHDVLLDLRWIAEAGSQAGVPAPVARQRKRGFRLAWALAALFAATTALLGLMELTRTVEPPSKIVSFVPPAEGTRLAQFPGGNLAVSPHGRTLAYVAIGEDQLRYLWLRPLDSTENRMLTGTEGARLPFWSPDGKSLGFFADGKLKRIEALGGAPLTLCDAPFGLGGSWSRDDVILFAPTGNTFIHRVPAVGGEPVPVTTGLEETRGRTHWTPFFLPDGKRFLYTESIVREEEGDTGSIRVGSIDGDLDREVLPVHSNAAYMDGHLIYTRDRTLIAQPFDRDRLEVTGDGQILAEPLGRWLAKASFAVGGGLLAYVEETPALGSQLTWYGPAGEVLGTIESPQPLDDIFLSRDERYVAVARYDDETGDDDIWTVDLKRTVFTRVTFVDNADDPVFSPDGDWIAYAHNLDLYRKRSNGAGEAELLFDSDVDKVTQDWSPDGKHILFLDNTAEGEDIWALPVEEGGEPYPVLNSPFREIHARLSPDGRWLAYASDESGQTEVYVMSWPDLRGKWKISDGGGSMPEWRDDTRELYFMGGDRKIMSVEIEPDMDDFFIGEPQPLFQTRLDRPFSIRTHQYVATGDGTRFLMMEQPFNEKEQEIMVTLVANPLGVGP
jgi:Tol biopolymer transport system component